MKYVGNCHENNTLKSKTISQTMRFIPKFYKIGSQRSQQILITVKVFEIIALLRIAKIDSIHWLNLQYTISKLTSTNANSLILNHVKLNSHTTIDFLFVLQRCL